MSKERFHEQEVGEPNCRRTKTVDKDILITNRSKLSQPIITTSELPQEQGIRNNFVSSLFHKILTYVM